MQSTKVRSSASCLYPELYMKDKGVLEFVERKSLFSVSNEVRISHHYEYQYQFRHEL